MGLFTYTQINDIQPIKDKVLVKNMIFTERLSRGGIIIPNDDGTASGIRPRWAEVFAIGPDQHDIVPGQWVLIDHGRWTRGARFTVAGEEIEIRMIDNNDILCVSDEPQVDETMSDAV